MSLPAQSRRPRSKSTRKEKGKAKSKGKGVEPAKGVRRYYSPTLGPEEPIEEEESELESLSGVSELGSEFAEEKLDGGGGRKVVVQGDEEEKAEQPVETTPGKIKGRKGHAGGMGKKGKKFVEDKSALLSLVAALPTLTHPRKPRPPHPSTAPPVLASSSSKGKGKQKQPQEGWETVPLEVDAVEELGQGEEAVGSGAEKDSRNDKKGKDGKDKKKRVLSKSDLRAKQKLAALAAKKSEILSKSKERKKARKEASGVEDRGGREREGDGEGKKRRVGFAV